jgi:hypothetical protein
MKKLSLQSVIEKYHLDGLVERVKWSIKDKTLNVAILANDKKNLTGNISFPFEEEDIEFVINNTSKLLNLLKITDKFILVELEKQKATATKMNISDTSYNVNYVLSDIMMAPKIPDIEEPDYGIIFNIDDELIDKFVKAKKALGNNSNEEILVSIEPRINEIKQLSFKIGDKSNFTNKIEFSHPAEYDDEVLITFDKLYFPAEEIKIIFDNNRCTGKGYLSSEGLIKFNFEHNLEDEICKSQYLVVAND